MAKELSEDRIGALYDTIVLFNKLSKAGVLSQEEQDNLWDIFSSTDVESEALAVTLVQEIASKHNITI